MKKFLKKILRINFAALVASLFSVYAYGQEFYFSQHYADKLSLNPAYAAVGDDCELGVLVRNQWPGVSGGYRIYMAEYQQKFEASQTGIGVKVVGNLKGGGAFATNGFSVCYARKIDLSLRWKCSLALQGNLSIQKIDASKLVFYSMIDPAFGTISGADASFVTQKASQLFFSVGGLVYNQNTMLGVSAHGLACVKLAGEKCSSPVYLSALANRKIAVGKRKINAKAETIYVVPSIIYRHVGEENMFVPGIYFSGVIFGASIAYKWQKGSYNSGAVTIGLSFNVGNYKIGYAYDYETTPLQSQAVGSHEVGVKYKLFSNKKNNGGKTILCPAF